jgi:hypothetical protein
MGRFFKKPDSADLSNYAEAERSLRGLQPEFVPDEAIPSGDETDRLHRWGYSYYREMFNARQLLGLEWSCRLIAQEADQRIRNALATNLSDLLRYQNMLCRYDTMALKSLDIFSVHGFPVGLIECESNLLGIPNGAKGVSIGSGGWSNIVEKSNIGAGEKCRFRLTASGLEMRGIVAARRRGGVLPFPVRAQLTPTCQRRASTQSSPIRPTTETFSTPS